MTNATIATGLSRIEIAISDRRSNQELADLLEQISIESGSLRADHRNGLLGVAGSAALFVASLATSSSAASMTPWLVFGALFWMGACMWIMLSRIRRFHQVQNSLQDLYEANLMNLTEEDIDPEDMADVLAKRYYEFQRGDYLREVTSLHSGTAPLKTGTLPYKLIQFHWVNERIVVRTRTDSKGNSYEVEETVYDHFYRTAILAHIDISIDAYIYCYGGYSRGESWKSASRRFNHIYDVKGETEIDVAKLMKPALVLLFEDLAAEFKDLNFEFSLDSTLLISMQQMDLLKASISIDLSQPRVAAAQLKSSACQPKISRLLSVVDEVNRHSVNELRRGR